MQRTTIGRSRLWLAGVGLVVAATGCTPALDRTSPSSPSSNAPSSSAPVAPGNEPAVAVPADEPGEPRPSSRIQSVAAPSERPVPADEPTEEPSSGAAPGFPGAKPALKPSSSAEPVPNGGPAVASELPELACSPGSFVLPGLDPSLDGSLTVMDTAYDDVESHCSMTDADGNYFSYTIVGGALTVADYLEIVDVQDSEITSSVPSGLSYTRVDGDYTTMVEVW